MNQSPAKRVAAEINRILKDNPKADLGDNRQLQKTLEDIHELDRTFEQNGGIFFHAGSNAFETAEKFTEIHVEQYRNTGRPSLPAMAVYHAERMGLDQDSPEYKAMILVAVRAEMKAAVEPDYHSKFHYMDVAAMTANLLEKNSEMVKMGAAGAVPLTKKEQALTFIAAIGHDLDHDGNSNPPDNPLLNEEKSFQLMAPLLSEAGLPAPDIDMVHTILMTTSPNGPHSILKAVAEGQRNGQAAYFSNIKGMDKFPDLKSLASNGKLTQMAAIVSDADLYASSGAGMKASEVMSDLLTKEIKKSGGDMDLRTDKARKGFFDHIVGEGYASNAGRAAAGESFTALRAETNKRIAAPPKP